MEQKKCKRCQRILPDGYKYKDCENCRNKRVKKFKDGCTVIGVLGVVGVGVIAKKYKRK